MQKAHLLCGLLPQEFLSIAKARVDLGTQEHKCGHLLGYTCGLCHPRLLLYLCVCVCQGLPYMGD